MRSRRHLTTFALLFSGMALFGSATPLSKLVVGEFPVFTASFFRVAIGALVIWPFLGGKSGLVRELDRRDWLAVIAIAIVGMFGFTVLLLNGMRLIYGVVGAIIMSTAPAVTATGSVLFLSDNWSRRKVAAVALSVAGIVVVNAGGLSGDGGSRTEADFSTLAIGSALVFGAVCCEAGYTLLGKVATKRLEPRLTVFLASAIAGPFFLAPAIVFEMGTFDAGAVGATGWLSLFVWGAGTLGLGSILWYEGLRRAEGTVAAGFMGVMPVSALVLSYILLSEPVRVSHLVGFSVVFTGVLIISREHAHGNDDKD